MLKYIAALVVIFGMAFVVARQDQRAADQAAQKAAERHEAPIANPNEKHPDKNIENPSGNGPRWYVLCFYGLFRWPNGTTTLAIVLTLLAIAEQSKETARAAKATERATRLAEKNIILQFRPKLIVRKVELEYGSLTPNGRPAKIRYIIANTGGTNASIVRESGLIGYADVPRFRGYPPKESRLTPPCHKQSFDRAESIPLKAGEDRDFSLDLTKEMFDKIGHIQMTTYQMERIGVFSICAAIQYADEGGVLRKTGIRRTLDFDTWRFIADEDSEDEYAD
ncbi:MAG: hypothetical protein ABSA78_19000 [Candidatus Sulfotelmatobacter sp.]|jgi:hypothetical protein